MILFDENSSLFATLGGGYSSTFPTLYTTTEKLEADVAPEVKKHTKTLQGWLNDVTINE